MKNISEFLNTTTGLTSSTQAKILFSLLIILFLWFIQMALQKMIWRKTTNIKTRYTWKRSLSFVISIFGFILIGAVWLPAFKQFGAFLGLLTAGVAIALKDPPDQPGRLVFYSCEKAIFGWR